MKSSQCFSLRAILEYSNLKTAIMLFIVFAFTVIGGCSRERSESTSLRHIKNILKNGELLFYDYSQISGSSELEIYYFKCHYEQDNEARSLRGINLIFIISGDNSYNVYRTELGISDVTVAVNNKTSPQLYFVCGAKNLLRPSFITTRYNRITAEIESNIHGSDFSLYSHLTPATTAVGVRHHQ